MYQLHPGEEHPFLILLLKKHHPIFILNYVDSFLQTFANILTVIMILEINNTSIGMTSGANHILTSGGKEEYNMRHFYGKRKRIFRPKGNAVIHVPSSMAGTLGTQAAVVIVLVSPSIFAGGSASSNIEAQDKDRTVNVGHHVGRLNIDMIIRNTTSDGVIEFAVFKVERDDATPALGTHPIPSSATIASQGMQQATRLDNPGKVFHFSSRAFSIENTITHKIIVSPAKYKLSKLKAGDHWILMLFNRSAATITFDFQGRYKEYE